MTNKKNFFYLSLFNSLKAPSFYIISILFSVFLSFNFYIKQLFFANGTSDLLLYFSAVPYISIIAIPALCFKNSFSVYDNFIPLKNSTRVLLAYLTKVVLFFIQIILMLPAVLLVNIYGAIDPGQLFTSVVCLIFYGAAVISVCSFIESLFTNRIIVIIISALFLALFNSIHLLAIYVRLPDFLVSLFKQLSFAWHFDSAGKGIFDSRDVLWLTGTSLLFLLLSDFSSELKAGRVFSKKQKLDIYVKLLFSILIMLNGTRWFFRYDFSQNKTYSCSKYTKELTSKIAQPVKITYYRSSNIAKLYPQIRDVSDFLSEYAALSKQISLFIKDPDKDTQSKTLLENYGIQTQQLRTISDTSTEFTNVYSAIIIENQGNVETIPFTMSATTLEYDLDGRIKHLITANSRTINIVIGNGMNLYSDYSYIVPLLNSQGFICNELSITDKDFEEKLFNSKGPLFVIGDSEIKIDQAIAIESYILNKKGNALFNVSPYSADLEEDWSITANNRTNIIEMLENWGCTFRQEISADISCSRITMYSDDNSHTQIINYPLWINLLSQENTKNGITLFWPANLELTENAKPYLVSSPSGFTFEIDKSSPKKLIETNPFIVSTINSNNFEKSTLILGAEISGPLKGLYNLESTDNSNIIVIPDQYFTNSLMNEYIGGEYGDYRNFDFLVSVLLKLNGEEELAALHDKSNRNTELYKINDYQELKSKQFITYGILFIIIPLLIIAVGVFINVYKKR